jgi:hypothetical protein
MSPADEMAAKPDTVGSEKSDQLRTIVEDLQRIGVQGVQPSPLEEDEPMERDDLRPGITSYLDHEASERKAIHDRLVAIENEMKKRGSRRFGRYLAAILIGVAATLAWQSYGKSAKQIIATRAPELGWSPEAKQMIATSIQWIGWTKPPVDPEKIDCGAKGTSRPLTRPGAGAADNAESRSGAGNPPGSCRQSGLDGA